MVPRHSRYVIDLNRPPEDAPMYPGANNTELCPTHFFTGEPLYRHGREPDAAEVARRRERYWRPYHDALRAELERIRGAMATPCCSTATASSPSCRGCSKGACPTSTSAPPSGTSCAPALRDALAAVLAASDRYSHVVDGRFKGGHITRHYGRPADRVHAVQLEMCWSCYMADEAAPRRWDERHGDAVRPLLRRSSNGAAWRPA